MVLDCDTGLLNFLKSLGIKDATPEIMDFVIRFGKEYGYLFETEANFEKFCLVNDAVYVAKFKDGRICARQNQSLRPYIWI